jgi:hypothetical protein
MQMDVATGETEMGRFWDSNSSSEIARFSLNSENRNLRELTLISSLNCIYKNATHIFHT